MNQPNPNLHLQCLYVLVTSIWVRESFSITVCPPEGHVYLPIFPSTCPYLCITLRCRGASPLSRMAMPGMYAANGQWCPENWGIATKIDRRERFSLHFVKVSFDLFWLILTHCAPGIWLTEIEYDHVGIRVALQHGACSNAIGWLLDLWATMGALEHCKFHRLRTHRRSQTCERLSIERLLVPVDRSGLQCFHSRNHVGIAATYYFPSLWSTVFLLRAFPYVLGATSSRMRTLERTRWKEQRIHIQAKGLVQGTGRYKKISEAY